MLAHNIIQGSREWHDHRARHFNASDAPAMLGCSPYKTRAQLLREMHTGLTAEVDPATQRRFDDGHRYEALARPLAEQMLGEELFPVTGSEGVYSASFDGLTMDECTALEHKTLNDELRALLPMSGIGGAGVGDSLPLHYRVQMEQQCMVSGCERVLFMASKWTDDGVLVEARYCWYEPDPDLRARIVVGWQQFEADLAAYTTPEAAERAVAAPQDHLPAVSVQVSGALAVVSNLAPFGVALREFIAKIPAKPSTDNEFATVEAACKRLREAEDRLQAAEDSALASMADVNEMRRMVGEFRELARTTRLASEKLVKQRKEQIRDDEVKRGRDAFNAHFDALCRRLGVMPSYLPVQMPDFGGAIKGLKTLDSVRNAIDTALAAGKIEASALADKIEANLKTIAAAGSPHLFADKAALAQKAPDDLAAIIQTRVLAESERLEAEHARIRAEEAARIEREQTKMHEAGDAPQSQAREAATARNNDRPVTAEGGHADERPAAAPQGQPTLTLGTIQDRLGFNVHADFLTRLGFPYTPVKAAKLYHAHQFPAMCAKLAEHVLAVGEQHA